jgi:hypothetical protein
MDSLVPNEKKNKKIAGIIGTIHPIKNVHVSIQRALNDKMNKIFYLVMLVSLNIIRQK